MNQEAIAKVQRCLDNQYRYLDLGKLGLTDNEFAEGSDLDILLCQCTHLQTLILSNTWWDWTATGYRTWQESQNNGSYNILTTPPAALKKLTDLTSLVIAGNGVWGINSIDFLAALSTLKELNMSGNKLTEIKKIELLNSLQRLDFSDNQITDISPLLNLLQRNKRSFFSEDLLNARDSEISVYGNPITKPPIEVVQRGSAAVLRYFADELENAYEAKLLVVGEPEAGKTSLIKKLVDPTYQIPHEESSTIGIQVVKWKCKHRTISQPIKLNVWDFGGQEMQYLTHQFFLSSDALYILLTSARKDLDNLDYWFNIISLLGKNENNQNSELIVVANEIKIPNGQTIKTFDVKKYKELYPYLPFEFHAVNLATAHDADGRFTTLQYLIQKKLIALPVMGRQLPVKWGVVRKQLMDLGINYIKIENYFELCKKADVEEKFALDLSNYLHKIGEVVHFENDRTVNNFVILNPKWAVDGIYSILKRKDIEVRGGHFTQQQVYDIWQKEGYAYSEKSMLLNLMVKDNFEVAYKIPSKADEYIAPQLLPLVQPPYEWGKADALHFRYLYPFMPKGIVTRLIVRLHEYIKYQDGKGLVWRSGVILEKMDCAAKVEETKTVATGQQVIDIELTGHKANRKLVLYDICRTIEGIHKDAFSKIVFERQVPCICDHCQTLELPGFFNYSELLQYIDDEIFEIRCRLKPRNLLKIKSLLEGIFEIDLTLLNYTYKGNTAERVVKNIFNNPFDISPYPTTPKKLFISYSKHDEEYKEEFRKHLVTLKEQKLISSFNCKEIDLGADWDETIQRELDECDIVICLVSVDFLNTDYIRKYEVDKAMEKGKQVIPILIKPCDWENSNLGKLFAPNRGKSISLHEDLVLRDIFKETSPIERAAGWVKIIKEMREKLFK